MPWDTMFFFLRACPHTPFVSIMRRMYLSHLHPVYHISETLLFHQHRTSTPRLDYPLEHTELTTLSQPLIFPSHLYPQPHYCYHPQELVGVEPGNCTPWNTD